MYNGYYYPFYRSFPGYPGPFYPQYPYYANYANYGSSINAFQSQLSNQSVINTGTATGINQVFTPTAIY